MTDVNIHLYDVDNDDTFPVSMHTNTIPRVGDEIYYWVDYPKNMSRAERGMSDVEPGEPQSVSGIVERVTIEYRRLEYGVPHHIATIVGVHLKEYTVTLYPKDY